MRKKKKRGRILPFVTLFLFCSGLVLLLNFESFSRAINSEYDKEIEASVVEKGSDPLVGVIPRIKVAYMFGGTTYEYNKVLYTKWLHSEGIGDSIKLYVNTKAPENSVLEFNFFTSITNIVLLSIMLASLTVIVLNIRRRIKDYVRKKRHE